MEDRKAFMGNLEEKYFSTYVITLRKALDRQHLKDSFPYFNRSPAIGARPASWNARLSADGTETLPLGHWQISTSLYLNLVTEESKQTGTLPTSILSGCGAHLSF